MEGRIMVPHDVEKDIEQLKTRLKEQPKSLLFTRLADAYRKAGDVVSAIELCTNGITIFPTYTTAQILLGRCYLEQQKYSEAIDAFTAVCRLDRRNQVAMKMLADVFVKQGGEQKAGDLYALLLAMDPLNTTLKHNASQYPSSGNRDLYAILGFNGSAEESSAVVAAPENEDVAAFSTESESVQDDSSATPLVQSIDSFDDLLQASTPDPVQDSISGGDVSDRMSALFSEEAAESPVAAPMSSMPQNEHTAQDDPLLPPLSGEALQALSDVSGNEVSERIDELFNDKEPLASGVFSDPFLDLSQPDDDEAAGSGAFSSEDIDLPDVHEGLDPQAGGTDDVDFGGVLEDSDSQSGDRGADDSVAEKALSGMDADSIAGADVSSRLEELFGEIDQEPIHDQVTELHLPPVADEEVIAVPLQETGDLPIQTLTELSFGNDESVPLITETLDGGGFSLPEPQELQEHALHTSGVEQFNATEKDTAGSIAESSSVSGDDVSSRLGELFGDGPVSVENLQNKSKSVKDGAIDPPSSVDTGEAQIGIELDGVHFSPEGAGEAVAVPSFDPERSLSSDALLVMPDLDLTGSAAGETADRVDSGDLSGTMAQVSEPEGTGTVQPQLGALENAATVSGNDIADRLEELFAEKPPSEDVQAIVEETFASEEPDHLDRYNQVTELHFPTIDGDEELPREHVEDMQAIMVPDPDSTELASVAPWAEVDPVGGISGGEVSDRLSEMFAHGEPSSADQLDSESGEIDEYTQFDLAIEPEIPKLTDSDESTGANFGTDSASELALFDVGNIDSAVGSGEGNLNSLQQESSKEPAVFRDTGMPLEQPADQLAAEGSFFATEFEETLQFDSELLEQMLNPVHPEEHGEVAAPDDQSPIVDERSDGVTPLLPESTIEEEGSFVIERSVRPPDSVNGAMVGGDDDAGYNTDTSGDAYTQLSLIEDYEQEEHSDEEQEAGKQGLVLGFAEDPEPVIDAYSERLSHSDHSADDQPLLDEGDAVEQGRVPDDPVGSFLDENFSPSSSQVETSNESEKTGALEDFETIAHVPQDFHRDDSLLAEADEAVSHHDDGLVDVGAPVVSGADVAARLEDFFSSQDIMTLSSDRELMVEEEPDEAAGEGVADFYTVTGENAAVDGSTELLQNEIDAIGLDAQLFDEDVPEPKMVDEPVPLVLSTRTIIDDDVLPDVELFEEPLPVSLPLSYGVEDSEPSSLDDRDRNFSVPDHVLTPTLADIYFQQGQLQLAYQIYSRLLKKDPDNEKLAGRIAVIEAVLEQEGVGDAVVAKPTTIGKSSPRAAKKTRPKTAQADTDSRPLAGVRIKKRKSNVQNNPPKKSKK